MSRPRIAYFYDADVGNFHYGWSLPNHSSRDLYLLQFSVPLLSFLNSCNFSVCMMWFFCFRSRTSYETAQTGSHAQSGTQLWAVSEDGGVQALPGHIPRLVSIPLRRLH